MIAAIVASLQLEDGIIVEQPVNSDVIMVYPEAAAKRMLDEWADKLATTPTAEPGFLDYRDMFFVEIKGNRLEVRISEEESVFFELADPTCFRKVAALVCSRAYSQ